MTAKRKAAAVGLMALVEQMTASNHSSSMSFG
jgi:hypothetical protein